MSRRIWSRVRNRSADGTSKNDEATSDKKGKRGKKDAIVSSLDGTCAEHRRLMSLAVIIRNVADVLHRRFDVPADVVVSEGRANRRSAFSDVKFARLVLSRMLAFYGVAFSDAEDLQTRHEMKEQRKETLERHKTLVDHVQQHSLIDSLLMQDYSIMLDTNTQSKTEPSSSQETQKDLVEEDILLTADAFQSGADADTATTLNRGHISNMKTVVITEAYTVSILHLACLLAGASWVTLNDIARWFREGRLELDNRLWLYHTISNHTPHFQSLSQEPRFALDGCKLQMHSHILLHITSLPQQPINIDFGRIVHRLLYDLDLPVLLLEKVHRVCELMPPDSTVDLERTRKLHPFVHKHAHLLLHVPAEKRNESEEKQHTSTDWRSMAEPFGRLPIEAKAAVYVMLTLRLMYGFDDYTEYVFNQKATEMNVVGDDDCGPVAFRPTTWLAQTERRVIRARYACVSTTQQQTDHERAVLYHGDGVSARLTNTDHIINLDAQVKTFLARQDLTPASCEEHAMRQPNATTPSLEIHPPYHSLKLTKAHHEYILNDDAAVPAHNPDAFQLADDAIPFLGVHDGEKKNLRWEKKNLIAPILSAASDEDDTGFARCDVCYVDWQWLADNGLVSDPNREVKRTMEPELQRRLDDYNARTDGQRARAHHRREMKLKKYFPNYIEDGFSMNKDDPNSDLAQNRLLPHLDMLDQNEASKKARLSQLNDAETQRLLSEFPSADRFLIYGDPLTMRHDLKLLLAQCDTSTCERALDSLGIQPSSTIRRLMNVMSAVTSCRHTVLWTSMLVLQQRLYNLAFDIDMVYDDTLAENMLSQRDHRNTTLNRRLAIGHMSDLSTDIAVSPFVYI